jgi:hypothetical protein
VSTGHFGGKGSVKLTGDVALDRAPNLAGCLAFSDWLRCDSSSFYNRKLLLTTDVRAERVISSA